MTVAVCVDDNMGIMFNKRRQSRDRAVTERILENLSGARLFIAPYSETLFKDIDSDRISVSEDLLSKAAEGDVCFVEDRVLSEYEDRIEKLIIYRWNRAYPADMRFDISLENWQLKKKTDFPGFSHENITEEIYIK